MLSWMVYSIVVSLLMSLAALAFERSALIGRMPTRWLWAACMVASVTILFIPVKESVQLPAVTHGPALSSQTIPPTPAPPTETSRLTLPIIGDDQTPLSDAISTLLDWTWRITSMALALGIVVSVVHVSWRRR